MKLSMLELAERVPTETDAYILLEEWRWHGRPVCPHCGSIDQHYWLKPLGGIAKTNRGATTERRQWKCRDCRQKFSVTTGTIMHGTHIPVRTWIFVFFELCSAKNGIASREIERRYDLSPKSAWFLLHRIRAAMASGPGANLFSGVVVADETWIGGAPKNRHAKKRVGSTQGKTDKTPVVSLIHVGTGEVRSRVVANVSGGALKTAIAEQVHMAATTLHTDAAGAYGVFATELAGHASVNHHAGEYAREGVSTNKAENYFSQLKRSIDGTHHHVSPEHLGRYVGEFDFRHSTHDLTDSARTERLIGRIAGKRLMYSDSR